MIKDSYPMNIGGELIRNELKLLTRMEQGNLMGGSNSVRFLVLHCSATRCNQSYTVEQMKKDHKSRGFMTIGYHFYIRRDGTMTQHRRLLEVGAHARPYNRCSIGICYEGGLDENGHPADTRTPAQKDSLKTLLKSLILSYPDARILGHRDLPYVRKECPCFDVKAWLAQESII